MLSTGSWSKLQLTGNLHNRCIFLKDTSKIFFCKLTPGFVAALKDQLLIRKLPRIVNSH